MIEINPLMIEINPPIIEINPLIIEMNPLMIEMNPPMIGINPPERLKSISELIESSFLTNILFYLIITLYGLPK